MVFFDSQAPISDFEASPLIGRPPLSVDFADRSTGLITSWSWDFGDGNTSTEQIPTHVFYKVGSFTARLIVTGLGGSDDKEKTHCILVDWDSDGDGLLDFIEDNYCTSLEATDSDGDGLPDGTEDANCNGVVDTGETNPCRFDSDQDGLSDGYEDTNGNGVRDSGELDPLDNDSDDDGCPDGVEKDLGTDPLEHESWPWIICVGDCDEQCDDCAPNVTMALSMTSQEASVNYLKMRNAEIQELAMDIADNILVGIESGRIVLHP